MKNLSSTHCYCYSKLRIELRVDLDRHNAFLEYSTVTLYCRWRREGVALRDAARRAQRLVQGVLAHSVHGPQVGAAPDQCFNGIDHPCANRQMQRRAASLVTGVAIHSL